MTNKSKIQVGYSRAPTLSCLLSHGPFSLFKGAQLRSAVDKLSSKSNFEGALAQFWGKSSRFRGLTMRPLIQTQEVNLYLLFKTVAAKGGFKTIKSDAEWSSVAHVIRAPTGTKDSRALREIYKSHLEPYEIPFSAQNKKGSGVKNSTSKTPAPKKRLVKNSSYDDDGGGDDDEEEDEEEWQDEDEKAAEDDDEDIDDLL